MASQNLMTKIILKGVTDPSLIKAFKNVNSQVDGSLTKLKSYGKTAGKLMKVATGTIVAGLGASTKSAIEYESAFAGVKKTVEETETTKYDDISKSIRNMAKVMPATTTEIAGVAEAAGQLGIKADDISKFTEVMVNLGTTTNLSSEEAATAIAKMFNITGTSMDNVDRFGATIVALGNNAATTESDIVNMATRIASSGNQIGLTEQQILAMATSLSSVGLEAEGGGTAISTVMSNIDKSVATNGETLKTWASTAGMSTKQFKKLWQTDAYGAMQKVIQGMSKTKDGGGNLNILLEKLGITGIRTSDTMKRLSSASGLMTDMTNLANKAWDENSALTTEAQTRYATMESRIQMLKNKLNDVGITVGNALMPVLEKLATALENVNWDAVANKIVGALNWISEHSTQIITVISALAGAFVGFKIAGFILTIVNVVSWAIKLVKLFGFVKVALAALGGPVTIVITVIGLLVGAFIALWNRSEGFRNFWIGLWNGIKSICSKVGAWLKNFFTVTIPNAFNAVVNWFKNLPTNIANGLTNAKNKIIAWGANVKAKAIETGRNFVNAIKNFFNKLPYYIGVAIGFVIGKILMFRQKLWNFATVTIPQFIVKVITWFRQLPGKIWTWLVNTCTKITLWGIKMVIIARQKVNQFITTAVNFIKTLPIKIWTWLLKTIAKIVIWGNQMKAKVKTAIKNVVTAVINGFKNLPSKVMTIGKNIVQGLWKGIKNAKKWLTDKVKSFSKGIMDGIKKACGVNSPSTITTSYGKFIGQGLGIGIDKTQSLVSKSIGAMRNVVTSGFSKVAPVISPVMGAVKGKIQKFAKGGTVTRPQQAIVGDAPETIVPHGNTPRNRALLNEAAAGVGVKQGGNQINITFAPVINGGNAEENKKMLQDEEAEFERRMDEYFAKKGRLAF